MKKECKNILIVALVLYIILVVLSVIRSFDVTFLPKITSLGNIYIPMTTVILLAYVWDRGEENLAKIGFACIGVSIIISALTYLKIISSGYASATTFDKILDIIKSIASIGTSLTAMLALFSIIPISDETSKKLQAVAIMTYIVYSLIVIAQDILDLDKIKILSSIRSIIYSTSLIAEYGMIITYLLNKKEGSTSQIENQIQQPMLEQPQVQVPPMNQQIPMQQPVQQQIQNQVPQQIPIQQPVPVQPQVQVPPMNQQVPVQQPVQQQIPNQIQQ